jgi:type I restriction enzyme S subunit
MGEVATIIMGQSPPASTYNTAAKGLPFFQGKAEFGEESPRVEKWCDAPLKVADAGDILLSVRAPVGPTNVADTKCCIGRGLAALRPKTSELSPLYLRYFFLAFRDQIAKEATGSTFEAISRSIIENFEIPFPGRAEQDRVAAVIEEARVLGALRRKAAERISNLVPSLFDEMFGRAKQRAEKWPVVKVKDAVELVNGRAFGPSDWGTEGLPIIRIQNLRGSSGPYNYFSGELDPRHLVMPGSILISWAGQLVSFGVYVWKGPKGALNQHIFRADAKLDFDTSFLCHVLKQVVERAKKNFQGSEMKHLTKGALEEGSFPYPPIGWQKRFGKYVSELDEISAAQENSEGMLARLLESTLHGAFQGTL